VLLWAILKSSSLGQRGQETKMFAESITRWLHKLFAWWPWKRSPESDYAHSPKTLNMGATQEPLLRTTVDGPVPQSGATSVVVEHTEAKPPSELNRPTAEERPERVVSSPAQPPQSSPASKERADMSRPPPVEATQEGSLAAGTVPPPTPEQKLEFLRYLVRRGIVNEGFAAGQVPEQYSEK
jgi:hypothetical protein